MVMQLNSEVLTLKTNDQASSQNPNIRVLVKTHEHQSLSFLPERPPTATTVALMPLTHSQWHQAKWRCHLVSYVEHQAAAALSKRGVVLVAWVEHEGALGASLVQPDVAEGQHNAAVDKGVGLGHLRCGLHADGGGVDGLELEASGRVDPSYSVVGAVAAEVGDLVYRVVGDDGLDRRAEGAVEAGVGPELEGGDAGEVALEVEVAALRGEAGALGEAGGRGWRRR